MITNLKIDNFKSLKGIDIKLGAMNFIVGPNASGKSNFAEALDFISHAIREDIAYAVAEKGGFYNICYRRQRRARGAISFEVQGAVTKSRVSFEFTLRFQLRTKGEDIRADFFIESEDLTLKMKSSAGDTDIASVHIRRVDGNYKIVLTKPDPESAPLAGQQKRFIKQIENLQGFLPDTYDPAPQQLLISSFLREFWPLSIVANELKSLRVFQLNPRLARQPAAPSVHGDLGRRGENLASALDRMRLHDARNFRKLSMWLRDVVPSLNQLLTDYTETRQLGLFFEEEGFAARWFAEDVSDGTIMCVALFLALLDRRHGNIVIEEPETSLHPWILRTFLSRCREESERRQIIITTHSPLAVAQSSPSELFLVQRVNGITSMRPAMEFESELPNIIRRDLIDLGQYWLSGGLGAVPVAPDINESELFGESSEAEGTR